MALEGRLKKARREVERYEARLLHRREKIMPALRRLLALRVREAKAARAEVRKARAEFGSGAVPEPLLDARDTAIARVLAVRERYDEAREKTDRLARRRRWWRKKLARLRRRKEDKLIRRGEWGAASPRGGYVYNGSISKRVQHHTAGVTLSPNASREQEEAEMRAIQRQHQGLGWTDIGYHVVVFPSGRRYEGRPRNVVGAHTAGHNTGSVGVSMSGNYETAQPTRAAIRSCRDAFQNDLPGGSAPLYGHRDLGPTACPGKNLYPELKEIS